MPSKLQMKRENPSSSEEEEKRWSSGFSWADDSDSDSDDEEEFSAEMEEQLKEAVSGLPHQPLLKSSLTPSNSPDSSPRGSARRLRIKSVRFAPIAEMRLIPSLPDLSKACGDMSAAGDDDGQAAAAGPPPAFLEKCARTVLL